MKKTFLVYFLLVIQTIFSQNVQEKHQRAKINYNQPDDLRTLESIGIPVDHGVHKKGVFIISDFSVSEIEKARNAGYKVDLLIEDSKEYFLQRNTIKSVTKKNPSCENQSSSDYQTPNNFTLGSMGGYLTYQEMLDQLDLMKSLYPQLISTKENISDFLTEGEPDNSTTPSIGGNGIKWVKISDNPTISSEEEPQILYTAIHHAREPNSLSQLVFYMWYLLENYELDNEIKSIVDNTELFFIPVVNPDGYLYNEKTDPNGGGFWRKNRKNGHGVDNNRNYEYYINGNSNDGVWGGEGASNNTSSSSYHGTGPFSEIENQAIKWFCEQHNFVMAFNNHSYGDLLLYPYGYTSDAPTPENEVFEIISEELVSRNGFNNILSSGLYPAAGDSDDYMYGTIGTHNKIYAMTPEIGSEFWPPSSQIEEIAKSMMYLNTTSAKMVNNYAVLNDTSPAFIGDEVIINQTFNLKRMGISGNGNFTISVNPISLNISAVGDPILFSNLELLEETNGSIQYTLLNDTQPGDNIVFELIVNNGNYEQKVLVKKVYGKIIPVFEDYGNSVTNNFNNNGWNTTNTSFVSPSSSITDSPNGNYQNNENKTITISEEVILNNAISANITFYAKWDIENNWDYVQLEVSLDNGNSWIPQCGLFTNEGSDNQTQPTGEPLYDGSQNDWVLEQIDLNDYLGEEITIRFNFVTDGEVRADGFYFDDLTINVIDNEALGNSDIIESSFGVHPNPLKNFLYITTPKNNYKISIYNIHGQLIRTPSTYSGSQTIDYGSLSKGIYLMKITSKNYSKIHKIIKQ
ncbi:MAG: T9SS type A sorting domain-containing protein [Flavobacterium sp.]|nr:T9SS type A sorting domain-containing protein [Flavobacterium sp.]